MSAQGHILVNFTAPARTFKLGQITGAFRQCISEWWRRIRERSELSKLSDRDLADFMCNKADARAEASKWFWEP
jgi:uncharacterized protein YjiS (DUF1127 family)